MTCGAVPAGELLEHRLHLCADLVCAWAASPESTSTRRINGRWQLSLDLVASSRSSFSDIRDWDGIEESLGVGMCGIRQDDACWTHLNELAEVHHADRRRHVAHDREVMAHEDHRQTTAHLEVLHEIEQLCLDRDIESRDRLIGDDQLRLEREGSGKADPLTLTPENSWG